MLDDIEKDSWLVELNWAQNWPGASSFLAEAKFWFLVSVHKNDLTNQKQEAPTNAALLIILLSKDIGSHHFLYLRDNCYPGNERTREARSPKKVTKQISTNDIREPNLWHQQSWTSVLPLPFPWVGCSLPETHRLLILPPFSRLPARKEFHTHS